MNANKLTQKAMEAIQSAQNIAIENNNVQICPEHLLYALIDQENGLIGQLLKKMRISMNIKTDSTCLGNRLEGGQKKTDASKHQDRGPTKNPP